MLPEESQVQYSPGPGISRQWSTYRAARENPHPGDVARPEAGYLPKLEYFSVVPGPGPIYP